AWAIGLKKAGYATSPTYHKKLIDIIERYQLHRYDRFDPSDDRVLADNRPVRRVDQPDIINDVKFTVARPGENLEAIATRLTVSVKSLINYNEKLSDTRQVLDSGTRIFIQPKRKSYRGRKKWHTVNGESMYDISQKYGIRLSKLYERNAMPEGSEPAEGERIKIRGGDVDAPPALRSSEEKPVLVADNDQRVEEEQYLPEPELEKEDVSDIPEPVFSSPPKSVLRDPFVFHGSDAGSSVDGQTEVAGEPGKLSFVIEPVSSQSPEEEILLEGTFGQESIATPAPEVKEVYHLVRKGETLWSISRRYGTTVEAVKRLNKIKETELRVGSRLRIE
ncbi:MAG: LysM peptidoglycan-binding domain-containing protein, partial [Saprospiraceae bacterium]|nr:LysM peptidoglycan-binding domain-containing protein [Saprospiraceae bacterium]